MKLELGDIKMDSDAVVHIGTTTVSAHQNTVVPVAQYKSSPSRTAMNRIWPTAMLAPVVAMAIFALGALLLVLSGQPVWLVAIVFFTLQIPAAAFFLAARSRDFAVQQAHTTQKSFIKDQERLLEFLARPQRPQTVSQICKQLVLPEKEVLEIVNALLLSQDLEEDVDLETGHFVYQPAEKSHISPDHKSAVERLEQTQKQRAISQDKK